MFAAISFRASAMIFTSAPDYEGEIPNGLSTSERRDWIYRRFRRDRWRTMAGVDENVGRVLDWLHDSGRADDTLVIYTSDHGYFLGDHGWYDKRFMYEPALRIPLVACCPSLLPGGLDTDALVMNVDVCPTILDFAGVDIPATVQGRSLLPQLRGEPVVDEPAYADSLSLMAYHFTKNVVDRRDDMLFSLTAGGWKYIHHGLRPGESELYDLEKDPAEHTNLAGDGKFNEHLEKMRRLLERARQRGS